MKKLSSMFAAAFIFSTAATASENQNVDAFMPATEFEEQATGPFFFISGKEMLFSDGSMLEAEELGKIKDAGGFLFQIKNLDSVNAKIRNAFCKGEATHFIWSTGLIKSEVKIANVLVLIQSESLLKADQVSLKTSKSCGHLSFSLASGKIEKEALDEYLEAKGITTGEAAPQGVSGTEAPPSKDVDPALSLALKGDDARKLVKAILGADNLDGLPAEERQAAEKKVVAYVKPLPASQVEDNRDGYAALVRLDPENATYSAKAQSYADKAKEKRRSIVKRMKKNTDKFRGITFYHHPSEPRYADTRSYVLPYVGEKDGVAAMRFVVHYTGDSWLFIQNAKFNIDGEIVPLRASKWDRDHDSEIWEWVDLPVTPEIRSLMQKIANSKETIIRFEGQQYYNNVTVRNSDKQAIKDMLLLEEVLKEGL